MRRAQVFGNATVFLLICSGIYGCFYSILLIWRTDNVKSVSQGFQTRIVYTADQIVQVALITQENRLAGAMTLINSIVSNTNQPVHFYIITNNETIEHLWEWIEQSKLNSISYEVKGLSRDWLFKNVNISKDDGKLLSYARIVFTQIFPNLKNRVIFLDDDIIVQGDIYELFQTKISPDHVGAFSSDCDTFSEKYKYQGNRYGNLIYAHKQPLNALQLNTSSCTFSLGVSVIDLQQWKHQNISQQALHWIHLNKKINLYKGEGSLPPLLISLYNKVSPIKTNWHVRNIGLQVSSRYEQAVLDEAKLLHWNGPHKPWTKDVADSIFWDNYFVPDPKKSFSHPRKFSHLKEDV